MDTKHCPKCNIEKSLDQFSIDTYAKSRTRTYCKSCEVEHTKAWRLANPEKAKTSRREYHQRTKETRKEKTQALRQENPEHYREIDRQKQARYRERHPDKIKARQIMTYKREKNHPDIIALYQEQLGMCRYCGVSLEDVYEIDHMTPLKRGGSNEMSNIALCCPHCNKTKADRTLEEWLGR